MSSHFSFTITVFPLTWPSTIWVLESRRLPLCLFSSKFAVLDCRLKFRHLELSTGCEPRAERGQAVTDLIRSSLVDSRLKPLAMRISSVVLWRRMPILGCPTRQRRLSRVTRHSRCIQNSWEKSKAFMKYTVEKSGKIDQTVVNKALEPNYLKVL